MAETTTMIDETYEFSAPRFFDFMKGESEEDTREAELWFDTALSYAPSPFMPRIKTSRSFKVESLCDFSEADKIQKFAEPSDLKCSSQSEDMSEKREEETPSQDLDKENNAKAINVILVADDNSGENKATVCSEGSESRSTSFVKNKPTGGEEECKSEIHCTPKPPISSQKGSLLTGSKKHQSAKEIASLVRNPSTLKPKTQSKPSQVKGIKPVTVKKNTNMNSTSGAPSLAQENQAIKRQKLEGGRSRQILNFKPPQPLPHKPKVGLNRESANICSSVAKQIKKEERKVYVRELETAAPFVSVAEMMRKFQSSTRDLSLPNVNGCLMNDAAASVIQGKPKLTLTRPKEPELETAQRVRVVRVKSTAELEEEMMANFPKFKARPVNKKILEAPTLPATMRSIPQAPEFQEFHFETMARANQHAEPSSVASTDVSRQNNTWKAHLTEPKSPVLQTSLRARPPMVKSSSELEKEELENVPKFKARPLNKKIFESKGELGIFCNMKRQVTVPQEFHFATDQRIPPPGAVADLFDKLSLGSEHRRDTPIPRNTVPNPFQLHTEERGAEKERKFVTELMHQLMEEERARIPKANPYPYTTDYPVIPPKPEPKPCTKAEPFQLESLVRHEEEIQREMEERHRMEKEEAQMRIFRAQPIPKEDSIPVQEKVRKPLTQVQQFNLRVDNRAVDRAEFDQKVKEKELLYKRYREESEAARMMEEEKALKRMRRTMVPHARPVPNFANPFLPQKSSKETTKAKSPNLLVLRRKERRNMGNVASSPASSMR